MITNFFKNLGKGILNIFAIPAIVVGVAFFGVIGIVIFVITAIKKFFLFITGRSLKNELPEDIEAKRLIEAANAPEEKVEVVRAVITDPASVAPGYNTSEHTVPATRQVGNYVIDQDEIREGISYGEVKEINGPSNVNNSTTVREIEHKSAETADETYEPKVGKF